MLQAKEKNTLQWIKALLNGFIVAIAGFCLYIVPAWLYARQFGAQLKARNYPPEEISRQVKVALLMFYSANSIFAIIAIVIITALVLWRAWAVARGTGRLAIPHGLLVAAIPVLAMLAIFLLQNMIGMAIVAVLLFAIAGLLGGRWGQSAQA